MTITELFLQSILSTYGEKWGYKQAEIESMAAEFHQANLLTFQSAFNFIKRMNFKMNKLKLQQEKNNQLTAFLDSLQCPSFEPAKEEVISIKKKGAIQ